MGKTTVAEDPDLTEYRRDSPRHIPSVTTITVDGTEYRSRVDAPLGHAERPTTDEQLEGKFRALCGGLFADERMERVMALSADLPELDTVDPVLDALVV